MNKKERVINTLNRAKVDRRATGFWLHFPKEVINQGVDALVAAHMQYKNETQTDILKIMNENEMRRTEKIQHIWDWKQIKPLTKQNALVVNQKHLLEQISEKNQNECYLIGTIHGILASVSHASGHSYSLSPDIIKEHLARDKETMMDVFKVIEESTQVMLEATLDTGVDGIYYAALGGEKDRLTTNEFETLLLGGETCLLSQVKKQTDKSIFLHMCKEKVELERYQSYPADVVNWAFHESDYPIQQAKELFADKIILGGFDDRSGVLVDGTEEEIQEKITSIEKELGNDSYFIGSDCTLPTEIDRDRIKSVVALLNKK